MCDMARKLRKVQKLTAKLSGMGSADLPSDSDLYIWFSKINLLSNHLFISFTGSSVVL